ncbi:MAG: type II toxin-antitoxin system RelE/ParE family toxin [Deltaproteobacteria bacterium]|nr:type II toxin-antitoxin system RelE/ParE family toxin [Deltaproteobacteria bacterium]
MKRSSCTSRSIAWTRPGRARPDRGRVPSSCKDAPHGRSREELGPSIHSFPVGDYIIFYRPVKGGIEIARILHGARDIDALF